MVCGVDFRSVPQAGLSWYCSMWHVILAVLLVAVVHDVLLPVHVRVIFNVHLVLVTVKGILVVLGLTAIAVVLALDLVGSTTH